jgi:glycine betaine/proline transport system permease protein
MKNNNTSVDMPSARPEVPEDRAASIQAFVGSSAAYYERQFDFIGSKPGLTWTFNLAAAILGPIWYGMRGMWHWALPFAFLETFASVQFGRGLWGDLTSEARGRIETIELQLDLRQSQLEAAINNNAANIDVFNRNIESLERVLTEVQMDIQQIEDSRIWVFVFGLGMLLAVKAIQGILANPILNRRYFDWLSDPTVNSGINYPRMFHSMLFVALVSAASIIQFGSPGALAILADFPTEPYIRLTAIGWIETFFDFIVLAGEDVFDVITFGIRSILDGLEILFVQTPWIVVVAFIVAMTGLSAGPRAAIYTGAFLAYMGLVGLWVVAMQTLALLGTAACISIGLGIPLGIFCARRPRAYSIIRPIMDFQQTMPTFVYMIPVIAFFGIGKPAAIVTCMIFGGPPVVRLTVLGLRGVPDSIREAAIAYGASSWYLLTRVDLPLAAPSIRAGMNQTILLSLVTVVVASLIGAKGLGEDVLEALQYASVGRGILAGFAILFLALIMDRVILGKSRPV